MGYIKTKICVMLGTAGSFFVWLLGGWSQDIVTLLLLMAADFLMGLLLAGVFHKSNKSENGNLSSRAGWKGLCKKGVILLIVLISHRLDLSLGTEYIRTATVIAFIVNESISIVENAGLMGVPLPKAVTKAIDILKNRSDEDEDI